MKTLLKFICFLIFIIIFTVGIAVITSNWWAHSAVAAVIHQVTGLPVTIDRVRVNLRDSEFGAYGIKVKNPNGFSEGVLASIPEIFVDFDLSSFIADKKIHFEIIRLNVAELSIIRNEQGVTNLDHLKTLKKDKKEAAAQPQTLKPTVKKQFLVDKLVLTIRNVSYTDRSLPVPVHRTIDLKINQEVFMGITNPGDIIRIILMKIVYNTSFATLGAPVDLLKQQFGPSLLRGQDVLVQSANIARLMGTQALGEGKKIIEEAAQKIPATVPVPKEVNQITGQVTNKATGLFRDAERLLKSTTDTLTEKVGERSGSSRAQS